MIDKENNFPKLNVHKHMRKKHVRENNTRIKS